MMTGGKPTRAEAPVFTTLFHSMIPYLHACDRLRHFYTPGRQYPIYRSSNRITIRYNNHYQLVIDLNIYSERSEFPAYFRIIPWLEKLTVTHVHSAAGVGGGLFVVRDHENCLTEVLIQIFHELEHGG